MSTPTLARSDVYKILQNIFSETEQVFLSALKNVKDAGLNPKEGNTLNFELMTRIIRFESELYTRGKREGFNIKFRVVNLRAETQSIKSPITVAIFQLDIPHYASKDLPFVFVPEIAQKHGEKIKKILHSIMDHNKSGDNVLDFFCLPELSIPAGISNEIGEILKAPYAPYVLAGFEYDGLKNPSKIFCERRVFSQYKTSRSKFEDAPYNEERMQIGDFIYVFRTPKGNFAVLICNEYIDARSSYLDLIPAKLKALFPNDHLNMIFVLSQNPKPDEFIKWAEADCDRFGLHIILCNASCYGNSSIISPKPASKGKVLCLSSGEQKLLCGAIDIRLAPMVIPISVAKHGFFFSHILELEDLETRIQEIIRAQA